MSFGILAGITHTNRRRRSPISALLQPALGPLVAGDTIASALSPDIAAASNYASSAGSITSVSIAISVNGLAAQGSDIVAWDDLVVVVTEVSDTSGNTRIWTRQRMVAGQAPAFTTMPDASLAGRSVTLSIGNASGIPEPAVAVSALTLNGADVIGDLAGTTYTVPDSEVDSLVGWEVTASNLYGTVTATGFVPVTANLDPSGPGPSAQWTLLGASHVDQSAALTGSDMRTVEFSADGMRAYAVFRSTQVVRQYDLSAPYDILSAAAGGDGEHNFAGYITSGTRGDSVAHGFFIRKDTGTTAWLWNRTEVFELTLSTPWDITTATNTGYLYLGATMNRGHDIDWKADGTRWFVDDRNSGRIYQFDCSTPWDIETSTLAGQRAVPVLDAVRGIELQPDGARMFLMFTAAQEAREYGLSTPWDVTSADLTRSFDVSGQSANPRSITFRPDGTEFFVGDASSRRVHVYAVGDPPDPDPEWSITGGAGQLTISQDVVPAAPAVPNLTGGAGQATISAE